MNENQTNDNSILLAALFHDIDKFYPDFWNSDIAKNNGFIKSAAACRNDSLVLLADEFQTGSKSKTKKAPDSRQKKLANLFAGISIKKNASRQDGFFIPRQKLDYSRLDAVFGRAEDDNFSGGFIKEMEDAGSAPDFGAAFSRYAAVFKKYLWCVPANSEDEVSDVSLWEHSALAAAIAFCLRRYCAAKNDIGPLIEKMRGEIGPAIKNKEKPFRLIVGDFSGIQKYIFELAASKKAGRRLKGRSFLVQMISEDIKRRILKDLGLPPVNAIICAGGKFIILVAATEETATQFKEVKKNIEEKIFGRFKGEIKFNLALSESFAGEEFADCGGQTGNFGKYFDDAFRDLVKSRYRPLESILKKESGVWSKDAFMLDKCPNDDESSGVNLCKLCKKYIVSDKYGEEAAEADENAICQNCGEEIRLGKRLSKGGRYVVWLKEGANEGKKEKECVHLLFSKIILADTLFDKDNPLYPQNPVTVINPDGGRDGKAGLSCHQGEIETRFFAAYTPVEEVNGEKIGKDFGKMLDEEISQRRGIGFRKMGILKGDVDSLGKIFYFGLKSSNPEENAYTAARLKTLSLYLNMFFEGYVNWLVENKPGYRNLYVIFAGGDDFTVVGYWDALIDFARELRAAFARFSNNQEVHFSAAIRLMDESWPIYSEIKKADEELEAAKDADENGAKDGICLFGKAVAWKEFDCIMEWAEGKSKAANNAQAGFNRHLAGDTGTVSMGYMGQLRQIAAMISAYNRQKNQNHAIMRENIKILMWRPYLYYFTQRNLGGKNQKEAKQWVAENLFGKTAADLKNLDIFTAYLIYKNRK